MTELTQIPVYGKWNGGKSAADSRAPFFAGAENQLVAEAVRWALNGELCGDLSENSTDGYYLPHSPLLFYGASGCGKTHLAHGIYQQWRQEHRRKYAVFLTGETFARSFADAINSRTVDEFHEKTRRAELFVLDDLEQLSGKNAAISEFLITLDVLLAERRTVVLTSRHFPTMRQFSNERLVARFAAGLITPILPPAASTRLALLKHFADYLGVKLTQTAANLLAKGLPMSVPRLFGTLAQLALESESCNVPADVAKNKRNRTNSVSQGKKRNSDDKNGVVESQKEKFLKTIDVSAAREAIRKSERAAAPTLDFIAKTTAKQLGLKLADLRSKSRKSTTVLGRGIAVYLARQLTSISLKDVGKYFGGRDHTTIAHAVAEIEQKIAINPKLRNQVVRIQELIGEG
ncbi:MAG: AAA family ATPase [Planctomycetaceae bacterium]|jgi:chromosomal replication initiator protein|nr:AAA family ATPase [Planctomycetaceae bacterium]